MSSKLIIAALAGVVVIGAGIAGFVIMQNKDENQSTNQAAATSSQQTSDKSDAQRTNIDTLLTQGATQKCTFSSADGEATISGTMYFSNKRMRGDFTTVTSEKTVDGSMIIADGVQYFWDASAKQGVKTNITQQQVEGSQQTQSQGLNSKQDYEFKCGDWNVDEAMFSPPADVKLTDLSNVQSLQDIQLAQ